MKFSRAVALEQLVPENQKLSSPIPSAIYVDHDGKAYVTDGKAAVSVQVILEEGDAEILPKWIPLSLWIAAKREEKRKYLDATIKLGKTSASTITRAGTITADYVEHKLKPSDFFRKNMLSQDDPNETPMVVALNPTRLLEFAKALGDSETIVLAFFPKDGKVSRPIQTKNINGEGMFMPTPIREKEVS